MKRSWVEVSLSRLEENFLAIRERLLPSTDVIAVVKADSYGHGSGQVAGRLQRCGVRQFAVATLEEAAALRRSLPEGKILVFGGCLPGEESSFRELDLTAAVFDLSAVPPDVKVELKVDTGMNRLGVPWQRIKEALPGLGARLTGLFSHLACAEGDPEFTRTQIRRFEEATAGLPYPKHIANSAGLLFPEAHLDAVRPGLMLYGVSPCAALDCVKPILSWKSRILSIRTVPKGESIGYRRSFQTQRDSLIGVLSTGYADGYNRLLSNRGEVKVRDRLVPVVGEVSMDFITVDLTGLPDVRVGETAVLLEAEKDSPLSVQSLAGALGTIPYEVLTSISARVERVYLP